MILELWYNNNIASISLWTSQSLFLTEALRWKKNLPVSAWSTCDAPVLSHIEWSVFAETNYFLLLPLFFHISREILKFAQHLCLHFAFTPKLSPTQLSALFRYSSSAFPYAPDVIIPNFNHFTLKMYLNSLCHCLTHYQQKQKNIKTLDSCCSFKSVTTAPVGEASEAFVECLSWWQFTSFINTVLAIEHRSKGLYRLVQRKFFNFFFLPYIFMA